MAVFAFIMFQPFFNWNFRTARYEVLKTFWHVMISPFGKVGFRHYWLATVLGTMAQANADMGLIFLYFNDGYWRKIEPVAKERHQWLNFYFIVIAIFPVWTRFW